MRFEEVVKAMREGKKVKRENMILSMELSSGNFFIGDAKEGELQRFIPNIRDLEADDWEVVEEKKTLSDKAQDLTYDRIYWEDDVKEFLKELRHELLKANEFPEYFIKKFNKKIDELAGERLK